MHGVKHNVQSMLLLISSKTFKRYFVLVCGAIYIKDNIFSIAVVNGSSMEPTFNPPGKNFDDILLVSKHIRQDYKNIRKNDIIIFKPPNSTKYDFYIKRLMHINGEMVSSPDFKHKTIIPPGHVWVEGDNKLTSCDSRHFGPISLGLVVGKPFAIIWPPSRIQFLKSNVF